MATTNLTAAQKKVLETLVGAGGSITFLRRGTVAPTGINAAAFRKLLSLGLTCSARGELEGQKAMVWGITAAGIAAVSK